MIGQDVCGKIPIVLIGKQEVVDLKDKLDKEDLKTSRWTCSRHQGQGGQGGFAQHGREGQGLVHFLPLQRITQDYASNFSSFPFSFSFSLFDIENDDVLLDQETLC